MPPVSLDPIQFNSPLPDQVEVVIIGGGIIGVSAAWFLAEAGVSVLLCEKGRIAGEQSSRNWGWIRQQGRDADELPIMMDSLQRWEQIANVVSEVGFARHGVLYLARDETELARLGQWLDVAQVHQLDSRLLTDGEVNNLIDQPPGHWHGALHTPSDARAEPFTAVPAIARHLASAGVLIKENCAVRSLETSAGSVSGVITEHGTVRAQSVLCAGGAWSSTLLDHLGVSIPQLTVRSTVARTESAPEFFSGNASGGDLAFRRRQDGGYTIAAGGFSEHFVSSESFRHFSSYLPALRQSARTLQLRFRNNPKSGFFADRWKDDEASPFERTRILNPAPSKANLARMRAGLRRYLPALAEVPFAEAWAGMIDVMPDVVPVMDEVAELPGLYIATGFSGHGFGIGPGAGRVMSRMMTGAPAEHDLHRFRLSRFTDGSPIRPGPGL